MTYLCQDEDDREIKFDFYCPNQAGYHMLLTSCSTNLGHLRECISNSAVSSNTTATLPMAQETQGLLNLVGLKIQKNLSFLDYVSGGCTFDFSIAIDFTGSNGTPSQRDSLHYLDP